MTDDKELMDGRHEKLHLMTVNRCQVGAEQLTPSRDARNVRTIVMTSEKEHNLVTWVGEE